MERLYKTRYQELKYGNLKPGLWRIFSKWDEADHFSVVGPQYASRIELLCDLDRYAKEVCGL